MWLQHGLLRHLLCITVLLLAARSCDAAGASVSLRARWQGTPYLLEAAEFLADESPQLYWQFLDSLELADAAASSAEGSSSVCWHSIIDQAAALCYPQVAKILPIVVGVRQYSARLQMFRQLAKQLDPAEEHCCFVDVHGTIVTQADQIAAAISTAASSQPSSNGTLQLLEADHVFNPEKQDAPGAVLAVLHAGPGSDCWSAMHTALKQAAQDAPESAPVVYAHRPYLSAACKAVHPCSNLGTEEQLVLPGYGVEAVLKNMEYSAMDDKAKADAAAAANKAAKKAAKGTGSSEELSEVDVASLGEVKGFKFDVLAQRKPHLVQELMTFRDVLESNDEEEAIKVWDLKDAGLQAASRVAAASDPLGLLAEISQNFLSLVSSLTRQKVSDRLRNTVRTNQQYVSPGANFMLLNGMLVEVKNFEIYSFLDRLRIELRLQGQLQGLGFKPGLVQQLLKQRATSNAEVNELRLDLSPMKQIAWLNNPEKDKDYAHLPGDMTHLLNMYPGRLNPMAANLFYLTVIGDPLSPESINMAKIMTTVRARQLPIRMGALLAVPEAVARAEALRNNVGQTVDMPTWKEMSSQERFARAFLTLKSSLGASSAWDFWKRLAATKATATLAKGDATATEKLLKTTFSEAWTAAAPNAKTKKAKLAAKKTPAQAWEDLMAGSGYSSEAGMQLADMSNYLITKGLGHLPKPMWWLNGLMEEVPEGGHSSADQAVGYGLMQEMRALQEHIYFGRLDDEQSVVESLLEMHQSVRRWNPRVLSVEESSEGDSAQKLVLVDAVQHPGAKGLTYLHSKGTEARVKPVTHWVVTDLTNPRGRKLASAAITYLLGDDEDLEPENSRTALVLAPGKSPSALDVTVVAAQKAFAKDAKLLPLLKMLITQHAALADTQASELTAEQVKQLQQVVKDSEVSTPEAFKLDADQASEAESLLVNTTALVTQQLQLPAKSCAVITNGHVLWVFDPREPDNPPPELMTEDFGLLQLYAESFQTGGALATYLKSYRAAAKRKAKAEGDTAGTADPPMSPATASTVVMVTASALAAQVYPDSRFGSLHAKQLTEVLGSLSDWAVVSVGPPAADAELQLTAILNPLTREAQRISQVLLLLKDVLNPSVKLYLNPQMDLSELPLKSYYRYALPDFQRDEEGRIRLPGAPSAYFPRLPQKRVLTLNLELPESWLVEPVMALHDLDNLRLADIHEPVAYAEYELDAIMLTGSCIDHAPGKQLPPPKGLELHLGTEQQPHMVDTLVMQNLGYFQLKASPGLWELSIAPGRSRDLYQIVSATSGSALTTSWGWGRRPAADSGSAGQRITGSDYSTEVLLHSFTGKHVTLKVQKRSGKESESLLPAADAAATNSKAAKKKNYGTINVFTVASGHMYERLQKIMILSVIKNTKSKVKFWIISNYMSPHHKRIIPAMAEKYGFEYEFVTYKWPHWLHKQTDKQRIIWAYKILFLDVLFPLDVPRMIFVDSDQVVRTDLAELYNMDLKGAPYAYTPFCDTNKETEPYRFWKTGFWKSHLGDKPYHISALYLIDLQRFRQLSAGDQLRVIYENLSKDPHSLANLDQDLPNYAQNQLPIFSLPQEWLWCESWCGNKTKSKARTIDLCNNPKTKEPKLQAARRIIAEWPALDEEQANFTAGVDAQFKAQEQEFAAGAAAADATAAADASSKAEGSSSSSTAAGQGSDHTEL